MIRLSGEISDLHLRQLANQFCQPPVWYALGKHNPSLLMALSRPVVSRLNHHPTGEIRTRQRSANHVRRMSPRNPTLATLQPPLLE